MRIAFVSSEVYPFSKTGGLADVSAALPEALARLLHELTVFTPLHTSCREWLRNSGDEAEPHLLREHLWIGDHQRQVAFRRIRHHGIEVVFIENDWAFGRSGLYLGADGRDYPDNPARFALFARAVLEYCLQSGYVPDIVHANDWQSALLPVYMRTTHARRPFDAARSVLTIHNLGYQGLFPAEEIYSTGLGWELFTSEALEYHGQLNLLKGGIAFADAVTTVSPTYAREIQTREHGMGLEGFIRYHRDKLSGIVNGIDPEIWNPSTDPAIARNYSAQNPSGKASCRKELQKEFGLRSDRDSLVLGMVTRFDGQKGVELVLDAIPQLKKENIQLVLLGSGDPALESRAAELSTSNPGRIGVRVGYDEVLAHKIYAGADALLMPSRYEPCGLNQLYAQRYGAVPIVRATGGLKDTVTAYSPARLAAGHAGGFAFAPFTAQALASAVRKAWKLYSDDRTSWNRLVQDIMGLDRSWDQSAKRYEKLYRRLAKSSGARGRFGAAGAV